MGAAINRNLTGSSQQLAEQRHAKETLFCQEVRAATELLVNEVGHRESVNIGHVIRNHDVSTLLRQLLDAVRHNAKHESHNRHHDVRDKVNGPVQLLRFHNRHLELALDFCLGHGFGVTPNR